MSSKPLKLKSEIAKNTRLPEFPTFTTLGPHHQVTISVATRSDPLYSDYNFISLWSWDHQEKLKLCQLNKNLVVRFQDYLNPNNFYYSFWGKNKIHETAKQLLLHSENEGKPELRLIPQFVVENLKHKNKFVIMEDRDSFDYIVAVNDMIELKNAENSSKRHGLNKFIKEYGEKLSVQELDIKAPKSPIEMLNVIKSWQDQMGLHDSYSENELEAVKKILFSHHQINTDNLHVVGIYLDNKLKAFSINELMNSGFAMGHYKKADRTFRGLGVALDHYTAKSLASKGVTHLNHEQDLGIEGLRKSKMASHPVHFLKKYTISLPPKK